MTGIEQWRILRTGLGLAVGVLAVALLCWVLGTTSGVTASSLPEPAAVDKQATLPEGGQVLWQEDGAPVCTAGLLQDRPVIVGDGEGGAIVAWEDHRSGVGVYAQRVYSDGTIAWALDGVSLASSAEVWPQITSDGSGGAIVVWKEGTLYTQRIYSDGTVAWISGGVPLCEVLSNKYWPGVISDRAEGAIVAWEDHRSGNADIYAQRVYSDGTVAWATDGISLSLASDDQARPGITGDGAGGAIVAWQDLRSGGNWDVYAQRVYSNGTVAWKMDGVTVSVASGSQAWPEIIEDGEGGAIIVWEDRRGGAVDIYAQRVYSDGTAAWATDGISLCAASGDQWNPVIVGDGAGGAIVAWQDFRDGENWNVYAQRVYSDGTMAWATDGIPIAEGAYYQWYPDIASDGAGGAIITWQDHRNGAHIFAQRVYSDGAVAWVANGIGLAPTEPWEAQEDPRIAADGLGGAVVAWQDSRDVFGYTGINIYAQRVGEIGYRWYFPLAMWRDSWGTADENAASQDQGGNGR